MKELHNGQIHRAKYDGMHGKQAFILMMLKCGMFNLEDTPTREYGVTELTELLFDDSEAMAAFLSGVYDAAMAASKIGLDNYLKEKP